MIQNAREYIINHGEDLAVGTIVGQTGSGKTHLFLNLRISLDEEQYNTFYTDLTSYTKNQIASLLGEIASHWSEDIFEGLKRKTVTKLKQAAENGNNLAERALLGGTIRKMSFILNQKKLNEVASNVIEGKKELNFEILENLEPFSPVIIEFLRTGNEKVLRTGFEEGNLGITEFKFLVSSLTEIGKIGVILFDELSGIAREERRSLLSQLKGLINLRPPTVLLFASTPGGLTDLEELDPPFTRRIAKPRVRCDINVPRNYKEIFDVIEAYFEEFNAVLSSEERKNLKIMIRELFQQGMKTLGDILPVMSNALEASMTEKITYTSIEHALKNTRLGFHSPKSEVGAPVSEYLRISTKLSTYPEELAEDVKHSIREIAFQAGKLGTLSYLHPTSRKIKVGKNGETVHTDVYVETGEEKICLNVMLSNDGKYITPKMAKSIVKITENGLVNGQKIDRAILLSNTGCSEEIKRLSNLQISSLQKNEIVDLLYLANNRIEEGAEQLKEDLSRTLKKIGILRSTA